MPLLQKFPGTHLDQPKPRPRFSRKAVMLIVMMSAVLWAALIVASIRYL